jgi:dTDP-glucose 4,6-dehydratase
MTRALVTKGAGFIGHNLSQVLLDGGIEVSILDDLSSGSPLGPPAGAIFCKGSVVDPPPLDGRFDVIYHLASPASPPRYLADPIGTLRTSAEGTRQMLDRAAADDAVFVLASTSEVYGDPLEHPQPESYFGNVDITSPRACYDEAKRYAEALTYAYHRSGEVQATHVARIFNTYGPAMAPDDGRIVTNFLTQALDDLPLTLYGDGSQTRSFCYVSDLVDGLIRLAGSSVAEPINIGNPIEMSVSDFADVVANLLGDTGRIYKDLPVSDPVRRQPDISLARSELGWEPVVPLVDGLQRTTDYLRDVRS